MTERPSATEEADRDGTASAGAFRRQVTRQNELVYHRASCRHVKPRSEEVPESEIIATARAYASGTHWVDFHGAHVRLRLCGLCQPWKAPLRPWPPERDPEDDHTDCGLVPSHGCGRCSKCRASGAT